MKSLLAAVCGAALLFTTGALLAQEENSVTITGCVLKGTSPDTYVLTNVKEKKDATPQPEGVTADAAVGTPPAVIYWLSSTKGLKEHVGHTVEVTGRVSKDADEGKVTVKTDAEANQPKSR